MIKDVKILEQELPNGKKMAIFCYVGKGNAIEILDRVVKNYVENKDHSEFIDNDNPSVRIVCPPIYAESFKPFANQKLQTQLKKPITMVLD